MKILYLHTHDLGVGHYRVWGPARALEAAGHQVTYFKSPNGRGDAFALIAKEFKDPFRWVMDEVGGYDVVHMGYSTHVYHIELLVAMRNAGKVPVVVDMDDDIYNVPPYNMAFKHYHPGAPERRVVRLNLKVADAVAASTQPLADEVSKQGDANATLYLPNLHDPSVWEGLMADPRREHDQSVRMLFAGGLGRFGDLSVPAVKEAVELLMTKFDGTAGKPMLRLFFVGCYPDWAAKWMQDAKDPFANRAFFTKFSPLDTYFRALKWISPDIMINPVDTNTFNASKSAIKAIEAGAIGAAFVCTDWPTHAEVPADACLKVANTTTQWVESLEALITDPSLRVKQSLKLTNWVDNYTYSKHINLWENAYQSVIDKGPLTDDALYKVLHKVEVTNAGSGVRSVDIGNAVNAG